MSPCGDRGRRGTVARVLIATATASPSNTSGAARKAASDPTASTRDLRAVGTVHTARATVQGTRETILVDAKGLPLYTYVPDTATTSHVAGQSPSSGRRWWPPNSAVRGTDGVLTSVATSNGTQIAYRGHFLYTFVEGSPGHVTGQGVQNFFVATPGLDGCMSANAGNAPVMLATGCVSYASQLHGENSDRFVLASDAPR